MTPKTVEELIASRRIWHHFAELSKVPRPSAHEQRIMQHIIAFVEKQKLCSYKQDAKGNLVVYRQRSGQCSPDAPTVVLQGHVDMVTEKNADTVHDFMKDPIKLRVVEGPKHGAHGSGEKEPWLGAQGTTLGADNGIAVACCMELLEMPETFTLPPLECLFTVEEETCLDGARYLDVDLIKGRMMLNLDSEEWGEITIGCAGGGCTKGTFDVSRVDCPGDMTGFKVAVTGLKGGHSGVNIHEYRANAVKLLARTLANATKDLPNGSFALENISGGDKDNAIPREAFATVAVKKDQIALMHESIKKTRDLFLMEYRGFETNLAVAATEASQPQKVLTPDSAHTLLSVLLLCPHGVVKMSHELPGTTETSNNVASIAKKGEISYEVVTSARSFMMPALEHVRDDVDTLFKKFGASSVSKDKSYPGWAPNKASKLTEVTRTMMKEAMGGGHEPKVQAIHAGLECGILGLKIPDMDMVSFGPTITGAHSPDEMLCISTVPPFADLVIKILQHIATSSSPK